MRDLISFATALALAAVVVLHIRRLPELVGLVAGFMIMLVAAFVVGPPDPWGVLCAIIYCSSGSICGPLIGFILRWIPGLGSEKVTATKARQSG
jgi:hypothetical protein